MRINKDKGFTLVELLVVIAIIGILAVVAVPALFDNINKAKIAELLSDYNTIKTGIVQYYAEENIAQNSSNGNGLRPLKDEVHIQSYFEKEMDKDPFGMKYYINYAAYENDNEHSGVLYIGPDVNEEIYNDKDAFSNKLKIISKYEDEIEKNSNGGIKVYNGLYSMEVKIK